MSAILILLMIAIYTFQSFLCRKYSETYPGQANMASPVFTVVSGLIVAILSFALTGFSFQAAPLTVFLGILNAVILFAYNSCMILASQNGPYSILMVFMVSGGIIIPAITAAVGFHETVSVGKLCSIMVILVAVYMISRKEDDQAFLSKRKFWASCAGLALFNGAYGAMFDLQRRLTSVGEKEEMVTVTYFVAFALSGIYMLLRQGKECRTAFRQTKQSLFYLLSCSVAVALAINLMVYILPLVNVTVLYTFDNAGVLLASVVFSRIFFKEKMSVLNWIGCFVMCLALIGVSVL